jgi:hypothetical protein
MADPEQTQDGLETGMAGEERSESAETPASRSSISGPTDLRSTSVARAAKEAAQADERGSGAGYVATTRPKTTDRGGFSSTTKRRALIVLLYTLSFVLLGVWFFAVRSWVEVPKTQLELGISNVADVRGAHDQETLERSITSSFGDLEERLGIGTFLLVTACLLSYAGMVLNLIDSVLEWLRARRERKATIVGAGVKR